MTLEEYRKKKNLTLKAMAKLLGFKSHVTVYNYENGREPSLKIAMHIKAVTKGWVKPEDFINKED